MERVFDLILINNSRERKFKQLLQLCFPDKQDWFESGKTIQYFLISFTSAVYFHVVLHLALNIGNSVLIAYSNFQKFVSTF